MSSLERYAAERAIRRLRAVHQILATALVCTEEGIADLERALASDEASRAQAVATMAARRSGVPAQQEGETP
jgi:hypothetical protein